MPKGRVNGPITGRTRAALWTASALIALLAFVLLTSSASAATLYVDDDWAGIPLGNDPDGAGPATSFGTDSFATIQDAVTAAAADDTIQVAEGAYAENVTIAQPLTLQGAGAATTTINPGAGSAVTIAIPAGGAGTVHIEGFGVTGGGGNGIVASATTVLGTLELVSLTVTGSAHAGFHSGDGSALGNVVITNSTFTGNGTNGGGGSADLSFFHFAGDATLTNVTITGGVSAHYAIQFKGVEEAQCETPDIAIGNVTLTNVGISGGYERPSLYLQCYTDLAGLSLSGLSIAADETAGAWAEMFAGHVLNGTPTPTLDLTDTSFSGAEATNISIGNFTTDLVVDATGVTFDGALASDAPVAAEDAITHGLDVRFGDSPTRGFVSVVAGNLYVTPNSASAPAGTTGGIQRAVDRAEAGETVNVGAGTYTDPLNSCNGQEASVCITKALTLRGAPGAQGAALGDAGPAVGAPVIDGSGLGNGSAIGLDSGVSTVTIEGFEIRDYENDGVAMTGGFGSAVIAWNTAASTITVQDNHFHDLAWNGVLAGSDDDTVQTGWTVRRNTIANAAYAAVELTNVTNSTVQYNAIAVGGGVAWDAGDSGVGVEVAVRNRLAGGVTGGTGVTVSDNDISGGGGVTAGRAGINLLARAYPNGSTATLAAVTVQGNTVSVTVSYGILVTAETRAAGKTATVSNLSISSNLLDANPDGIGLQDVANPDGTPAHSAITIENNAITNSTGPSSGVRVLANTNAAGITVRRNLIDANTGFGANNQGGETLNAEDNWWGCAAGPGDAACDAVNGAVDGDPWLQALDLTASSAAPIVGQPVTVSALLRNSDGADAGAAPLVVRFTRTGANALPAPGVDDAFGSAATHTYTGASAGTDTLNAAVLIAGQVSALTGQTIVTWASVPPPPPPPPADDDENLAEEDETANDSDDDTVEPPPETTEVLGEAEPDTVVVETIEAGEEIVAATDSGSEVRLSNGGDTDLQVQVQIFDDLEQIAVIVENTGGDGDEEAPATVVVIDAVQAEAGAPIEGEGFQLTISLNFLALRVAQLIAANETPVVSLWDGSDWIDLPTVYDPLANIVTADVPAEGVFGVFMRELVPVRGPAFVYGGPTGTDPAAAFRNSSASFFVFNNETQRFDRFRTGVADNTLESLLEFEVVFVSGGAEGLLTIQPRLRPRSVTTDPGIAILTYTGAEKHVGLVTQEIEGDWDLAWVWEEGRWLRFARDPALAFLNQVSAVSAGDIVAIASPQGVTWQMG